VVGFSRDALVCGVGDKALKKNSKMKKVFTLERQDRNQDRMGLKAAGFLHQRESWFQNKEQQENCQISSCVCFMKWQTTAERQENCIHRGRLIMERK